MAYSLVCYTLSVLVIFPLLYMSAHFVLECAYQEVLPIRMSRKKWQRIEKV